MSPTIEQADPFKVVSGPGKGEFLSPEEVKRILEEKYADLGVKVHTNRQEPYDKPVELSNDLSEKIAVYLCVARGGDLKPGRQVMQIIGRTPEMSNAIVDAKQPSWERIGNAEGIEVLTYSGFKHEGAIYTSQGVRVNQMTTLDAQLARISELGSRITS